MAVQSKQPDKDETVGPGLSDEDRSKEKYYEEVAALGNAMIAAHGRDFAMGVLVLAARFIAENKPLSNPAEAAANGGSGCKDHDHHHKN